MTPTQPTLDDKTSDASMSRRNFLRGAAAFGGLTALAASLAPLRELGDFTSSEQFLQKYYKELTPEDMTKVIARIEREVQKEYGVRPHVRDLKPMDGVQFVYCLNLTRCIGSASTPASTRTTSPATPRSSTSAC